MSSNSESSVTNQRAPRFIKNPSGYHSYGSTHKEKVVNLGKHIKQFGWDGSWAYDDDAQLLTATMVRGTSEVISIEWPDDQWWPDVFYRYGGDTIKCRNMSAAAKLASEKPDPERLRKKAARVRPYRVEKGPENGVPGSVPTDDEVTARAETMIDDLRTTLPFDRESTPEEIKAVLKKRTNPVIIWVNRLSGQAEQDYIKTWSRHLKVTKNKEGKIIISFVGANCFHAVYVDSVIGIS